MNDFIFRIEPVSMSRYGGRKPCSLLTALRHNRREIQAELGATSESGINPALMHLNEVIAGPGTAAEVVVRSLEIAQKNGVDTKKLRKDHVQALEIVFSLQPGVVEDDGGYFRSCVAWAEKAFAPLTLLAADIHRDQGAPHCHVLISPFYAGKTMAREVKDKRNVKKLTDSLFRQVAGPAGLRRADSKLAGQSKQLAVEAVVEQLQDDDAPELTGRLWPMVLDAIKRDPMRAMNLLGIDLKTLRPVPSEKLVAFVEGGPNVESYLV